MAKDAGTGKRVTKPLAEDPRKAIATALSAPVGRPSALVDSRLIYSKSGMPNYKRYLDEMPGVSLQNVWTDMPALGASSAERLG